MEYIKFGHYPQTENGGVRPILWRVLDRTEDGILLISEWILDSHKYQEDGQPVEWNDCTLRSWLNDDFLSIAFDLEEQKKLQALPHIGERTLDDKVSLLTVEELKTYENILGITVYDKRRRACATPYGKSNGLFEYPGESNWGRVKVEDADGNIKYHKCTWWWLLSHRPGNLGRALDVCYFGRLERGYWLNDLSHGPRPIILVKDL